MNGFLILARCGIDDIPMALLDNEEDSKRDADRLTEDHVMAFASNIFKLDTTHIIAINVVTFKNGVPVSFEVIKNFECD